MKSIKLIFIITLFSCTQNRVFTAEKNGGNQPFDKAYKVRLSNDTLFLSARINLKIEGEFFRIMNKKEKKVFLAKVDDFDISSIKNSYNGSKYIFHYKDKKEEFNRNISGLVPKKCKLFMKDLEKLINESNWVKNE